MSQHADFHGGIQFTNGAAIQATSTSVLADHHQEQTSGANEELSELFLKVNLKWALGFWLLDNSLIICQ